MTARPALPTAVKVILLSPNARTPQRSTAGAGGYDLFSDKRSVVPAATSRAGKVAIGRALISTGIALTIPRGCVGRIGSRSGLSTSHNIEVGAGWIDSDYRGEVKIELKNLGPTTFIVEPQMRIAQLLILRLADTKLTKTDRLSSTRRGPRGFGSTGSR